ncbi:MAG: MerR family transcriptional regulator [Anaerolineae bacterium]|nr:MerR family transcriptional regulator [Anaerolineae bacterium]
MNNEAVYNIGVVARMTGIPENTLRVWERRYDFPASDRTEGGHRLYSPHEVARIQWVKQRIDEGMQTSNAIRALVQVEEEGRFPNPITAQSTTQAAMTVDDASSETIRARLFEALTAHNETRAHQIIGDALATYSVEDIILSVIGPTFTAIGEAWLDGKINIATEHFATNHLRRQLLMWRQTAPPAYPVKPVVLACAPGELHEGGLIMLGVLLRRLRWPVVYLGQSVDLPDLASFATNLKPAVIVFVAMTEVTAQTLSRWPEWLPNDDANDFTVAFGGYVFTQQPEWIEKIAGQYLGDELAEGVQKLDNLLHDLNPLLR